MKVFVTGGSGFVGKALIKYLIGTHGDTVVALCRSQDAEDAVLEVASQAASSRGEGPGAEDGAQATDQQQQPQRYCSVVRGDLDSEAAMSAGMAGCEVVYHLAAWVNLVGQWKDYHRVTVQGTRNALSAARAAGVPAFLHVSSFTVLIKERAAEMLDVAEDASKQVPAWAFYGRAKAMAEDVVLEEARAQAQAQQAQDQAAPSIRAVTVRPGFVWGPEDTSVIPILRDTIAAGTFRWLSPGTQRCVTIFIDNLCYAIRLAAVRGVAGRVYHVQDKESPMLLRDFFSRYAAAALPGVNVPDSQVSGKALWTLATVLDSIPVVNLLSKRFISRQMLVLMAHSLTFQSTYSETELGYDPPLSFDEGLARTKAWAQELMMKKSK